MKLILTSLTVTGSCLTCFLGIGLAGSGVGQHRDDTSGRLSHLGDDIGIYSKSHDTRTIVTKPGTERPIGLRPHAEHGEMESGNRSSFGTPLPPNNLTPAPVLPFNPNRALSPPLSPNSRRPSNGQGRFGR